MRVKFRCLVVSRRRGSCLRLVCRSRGIGAPGLILPAGRNRRGMLRMRLPMLEFGDQQELRTPRPGVRRREHRPGPPEPECATWRRSDLYLLVVEPQSMNGNAQFMTTSTKWPKESVCRVPPLDTRRRANPAQTNRSPVAARVTELVRTLWRRT